MFLDGYDSDYEEMMANRRQQIKKGIILVLCIVICVIGVMMHKYNNLVEKEENVKLAESNVENMMQRRLELIPDLVRTVEAFSNHEKEVFTAVSNARAELTSCLENGNVSEISEANSELSRTVNKLIAIAERYPELTSGQHYISLMDQLEGSVNRIAIAREDHIQVVSEYNKSIRKFPESVYARLFGFKKYETFEADKEAKRTTMVHFGD